MKRLFIALMMLMTLSISSQESGFGNDYIFASDNFIRIDHQYHFIGGGIFGSVGYMAGLDIYDGDRSKAIWTGVGVGTGVGLIKELTDISKTGFDTTDLAWTFVGATVSTWITDKLHYDNYMERKRKEVEELENERLASLTDEERMLEEINKR